MSQIAGFFQQTPRCFCTRCIAQLRPKSEHKLTEIHGCAGGFTRKPRLFGEIKRLQVVYAPLVGQLLYAAHADGAETAARRIDHAAEADRVPAVNQDLEVSQDILDFLPFVEPDASYNHVGQAGAAQFFLQRSRLRIGSIEQGEISQVPAVLGARFLDLTGYPPGLVPVVQCLDDANLLPGRVVRPQLLPLAALVVPDDFIPRFQDQLGGPVVLFKPDNAGFGVVLFEFEDVADVRAAPGIDGLVVVPYHT